jgi:hypothetical protein
VDYVNLRRETFASLEAQTLIVAMNSGAPLAFADRYNAAEALAAFRARPAVAEATLFDVNGATFASWRRATQRRDRRQRPAAWQVPAALVSYRRRWRTGASCSGASKVLYDLRTCTSTCCAACCCR